MKRTLIAVLAVVTMACGAKLPPITITLPPPVTTTPKPEPAPPVTPPPAPVEPPVIVLPPPEDVRPLQNLNITVHDATGAGIATASCVVNEELRKADGAGFINFAVRGSTDVACGASGFVTRHADLPPGDHRFPLERVFVPAPPKPEPPPTPAPTTPVSACGPSTNDGRVSFECLDAIGKAKPERYDACKSGSALACHLLVRDAVTALRAGANQTDPSFGWGLLTKGGGEQGCTATECDGALPPENKFGEDVITYLRRGASVREWTGLDVVGGIGAPGARFQGGTLGPANTRPTNKWGLPQE